MSDWEYSHTYPTLVQNCVHLRRQYGKTIQTGLGVAVRKPLGLKVVYFYGFFLNKKNQYREVHNLQITTG